MGGPLLGVVPNHRTARMAVEDPLSGIIGIRMGEAVGVMLHGDPVPVIEVEWNLDQGCIGNVQLLIDSPNCFVVFWRGTEGTR